VRPGRGSTARLTGLGRIKQILIPLRLSWSNVAERGRGMARFMQLVGQATGLAVLSLAIVEAGYCPRSAHE
jgi:hypothetical protein